ncbi:MAG: DUF4166 domain-containing protein [Pseudomonadota bacterium]
MKPELANVALQVRPQPKDRRAARGKAYDTRFRRLVGKEAWESLPQAVQRRFSKRIEGARVVIYPGVIKHARFSRAGRFLAQLCRLIDGPLPLSSDCGVPAAVSVSEDCASGGQCWTRVYGRKSGFPQVIHSAKCFAGPTGIEEHIGRGIGMALKVVAVEGGLKFRSDHYFIEILGHRVRLPRWLEPGRTTVRHIDQGEGRFVFSLELSHPWLGELVYQEGVFEDA